MPKFVPRERKHRRLAKQKDSAPQPTASTSADANASVILPSTAAEKESRRQKLQEELRAQQPQSKISSKKRKRLDHYVDTKLRREENAELIRKLAAQNVDTSLFQSAKKLGRVGESKREALERALKERSAGVDVRGDHDEILLQRRKEVDAPVEAESEEDEDEDEEARNAAVEDLHKKSESAPVTKPQTNGATSGGLFGAGLKRPLEMGEDGRPMIKKRKRRKKAAVPEPESEEELPAEDNAENGSDSDEDEFKGFDSDPSPDAGVAEEEQSQTSMSKEDDSDSDSNEDGDEDDDESEEDEEEPETDDSGRKARSSAFKLWANEQRNESVGFKPSTAPTEDATIRAAFKPRQPSPDPIAQALASIPSASTAARPKHAVTIPRAEEIEKTRLELPVVQEEQKIMEAIHNHPTVVVCGATGSGKTTQVPQMMYEAGYGSQVGATGKEASKPSLSRGMIGVTQPRRVAAVSVADRVATELGPEYKSRVGHQVRYDTTVSRDTAIKFMTDGILLREIGQDFVLSKYSAIVIDEAHERSVNTDILIGMLSRIVNLREELSKEEPEKYYPLKLVIMSATLRVSDFMQNARLFRSGAPPIVEAEGRQYPVTVHFSRKTQRDFVQETVSKVARGHRKLPPGSMLVFLTGQNEIQTVAKRLKDTLGGNTAGYGKMLKARESADAMPLELDDLEDSAHRRPNDTLEGEESDDSEAGIEGLDEAEDAEFDIADDQQSGPKGALKPHILPLYASLPTIQQMRVFQPPPEGSRLIVLATNVAETSLTIPGIKYVFDCGRSKEKKYDTTTGVQTFEIDWISKASASQRTGRAGRTGPGHCYRLYSSAVYEEFFAEHAVPEILRTPLESTVLQLKAMEIDNLVNFPYPTPPDRSQLATAEKLLKNLGAIEERTGKITSVGRELIMYPVSPRFGKILMLAQRNGVVAQTIAAVAALAVGDLIVPEPQLNPGSGDRASAEDSDSEDDRRERRVAETAATTASQKTHQAYTRAQATLSRWDDRSDAIKMLTAVAAHADATSKHTGSSLCADFFLREKNMQEVQQLRQQLHNIVRSQHRNKSADWSPTVPLPSEKERKILNQVLAAGFVDQIAIRSDLPPSAAPSVLRKPRRANEVPYTTLFPSNTEVPRTASPEDQELARSVFVHSSSILAHLSPKEMPAYVVYSHLSRAAPSVITGNKTPRTRMHPLTALGVKQIAALAEGTPLLEMGKPIGKIEDLEGGKARRCWVGLELRVLGGGGVGWPVGAWKVLQRRGGEGEWMLVKVLAR